MQSIKIYLLLALVVTFMAGIAGGLMLSPNREPARSRAERGGERGGERGNPISKIVDELKLTGEQREKVMDVFRKAMAEAPAPPFAEFRKCDKKRDTALDAMLTADQREKASQINGAFEKEMEDLNAPGMAVFKKAQADARALLTPQQQMQFDKLIAEKMPSFRGRWRGTPGTRDGDRVQNNASPATRPR